MFIVFVDYQRLTMVPTCSSMCFNDLLCSSSCCDDDRKLSMSDWAFCVNPCMMCNPTETETIYYIYIWVVDSDCIFHLVTATCRYECMLSIHMMSWIIWYTWIYMDIHVCMVPFSFLFSSSIQRCPMETSWSTAVTWPTVALPPSYRRLTPGWRSAVLPWRYSYIFLWPPRAYEIARLGAT